MNSLKPRRQILNIVVVPALLTASLLITLLNGLSHPLLSVAYAAMLTEGLISIVRFDNNAFVATDDFRFRWGAYGFRVKYILALSIAFIPASLGYSYIGGVVVYLFAFVFVFFRLWLFESLDVFLQVTSSNASSAEVLSLAGSEISISRESNIALFKEVLSIYVKDDSLRKKVFSDCQFSSLLSTDKAYKEMSRLRDQHDPSSELSRFQNFIMRLKTNELA